MTKRRDVMIIHYQMAHPNPTKKAKKDQKPKYSSSYAGLATFISTTWTWTGIWIWTGTGIGIWFLWRSLNCCGGDKHERLWRYLRCPVHSRRYQTGRSQEAHRVLLLAGNPGGLRYCSIGDGDPRTTEFQTFFSTSFETLSFSCHVYWYCAG